MTSSAAREAPTVLIITDDFGGGTGTHMLQLVNQMTECWPNLRDRVEVLTAAPRTARIQPSVRVTRLPEESIQTYPLMHIARLKRLAGIVRDRSPDIVHTYFFWSVLYGRLLKAGGLIPNLVENREDEGIGWSIHEYLWLRLTRAIPDRVICVSDAVRRAATKSEKLRPDVTTVIHNGVPMPDEVNNAEVRALRNELDIPAGAPVVGMVANLNRSVKGVAQFIEAVPAVIEEVPEVHCVVVGGGAHEETFRDEARSRGLEDRLHFTGYREDVDQFYHMMDVSVLTSSSEGLSITLLESMSHGLPVVATRVGGNPEVVADQETGFLVPFGESDPFVRRVVQLLRDSDLRTQMGEAGRQRIRSEFTIDRVAERYATLYKDILARDDDERS